MENFIFCAVHKFLRLLKCDYQTKITENTEFELKIILPDERKDRDKKMVFH